MTEDTIGAPNDAVSLFRERAVRAEAALEQAQLEIDALRGGDTQTGHDTTVLAELAETLRWNDAPHSLRLVLPLARVIRWVSRRVSGLLHGPLAASDGPAGSPRSSLGKRVAVRGYTLTRPLALPIAIRLHSLLSRLLERESIVAQRRAAATSFAATADAELLRSIEAAMLTLALQPRVGRP